MVGYEFHLLARALELVVEVTLDSTTISGNL